MTPKKTSKKTSAVNPRFFATPADFRAWFERHHDTTPELLVGFHKKGSGKPSITWPESVDEALCFGWIDGIRRTIDDDSYSIRFTPRRPRSIWSTVNINRVAELTKLGRMHPAGLKAFAAREAKRSDVYSYEQERDEPQLDEAYVDRIRANSKAWAFYDAQPPFYKKLMTRYVMQAKQEETRLRRLDRLIADSAAGRRVGLLERPKRRK